jgi:Tol biopolymer transport system component
VPARTESPGILFYTHPNDANGTARINLLPTDEIPLGRAASPVELTTGTFPTWSPDHSQIAFSRRGELFIATVVDGRIERETPLTTGPGDIFPTWSAHGCIAFVRGGTEPGIWLVAPDGSYEGRLVSGSSVGAPDWSPDGLTLAYMRNVGGGKFDVDTVSLTDRSQRSFLQQATSEMTPKWSPDGSQLAYVRGDAKSNRQDVFVAAIEWREGVPVVTAQRQLTDTDPDAASPAIRDSNPAWSPAGDRLVWYRADEETRAYRLWTMDVATGFSSAVQLMGDDHNAIDPVWR